MFLTSRVVWCSLILASGLSGCSTDIYRSQGDALQLHGQKFQTFLHHEQVEAALHEIQAIELIGMQLKAGRLPGTERPTAKDLERQTRLLDSVREHAAANWIALAQYFSTRQHYGAARALYQRVMHSYAKGVDRLYAEYARQALADMDILALGQGVEATMVGRTALSALQDGRRP